MGYNSELRKSFVRCFDGCKGVWEWGQCGKRKMQNSAA